jgi:nucleoside-diphosphate-sugar epimerase
VKAFVTGGTGFVGSHLVEALLVRGDRVSCLVRDPRKAAALFAESRALELVAGDLDDERALERGAAGAEVVYHMAGLTGAWREADLFHVNRDGTARLVTVTSRVAPRLARFVYVSTLAAAGPARPGAPRQESEPDAPVSGYGQSKLAGEAIVRRAVVPWTIVRPPSVYGPRDREFLPLFRLAKSGTLPMLVDPAQELSLVHARDLAAALLKAAEPGCKGRTYFACHPEVVTARATATLVHAAVQQVLGRPARRSPVLVRVPAPVTRMILWVSGAAAHLRRRTTVLTPGKLPEFKAEAWTCSPTAFERDTGWRATISLAEGVPETAGWYARAGWL